MYFFISRASTLSNKWW